MKRNKLTLAIFGLAVLLSSCSRQYDLQFAGHYKPNTEVAKDKIAENNFAKNEEMQPISTSSGGPTFSADANASIPDLKLSAPHISQIQNAQPLTSYQQKKVEKITQNLQEQIEKNNKKIEKLQNLNSTSEKQKDALKKLDDDNKVLYAILGFLIPPLGVGLYEGEITSHFWIALLLMLLLWLPGAIYALVIILG